jgi:integrase
VHKKGLKMHVCRVGRRWYFRIRVPKDLLRYFPSWVVKKSLRTGDLKSAKARVNVLALQTEKLFALIRSGVMTEKQIRKLVDDYFHKTLREVEDGRAFGYGIPADEDAIDGALETHDWFIHEHKKALSLNKLEVIEHQVESLLQTHSIELDKGSDEYKKLSRELLKATIEVLKVERERLTGNYDNDFDDVMHKRPSRDAISPDERGKALSEVIQEYMREKKATNAWIEKTSLENKSIYDLFLKIVHMLLCEDDTDIRELSNSRETIVEYRELLRLLPSNLTKRFGGMPIKEVLEITKGGGAEPMSSRTRNKHLQQVSSLFKWCVERGYIDRNPAEGLKEKRDRQEHEEREAYASEDLGRLFASPIYISPSQDRPDQWWVPLMALYSGMRLEEICQLYLEDIKALDGVWCFDINNHRDKKLKTLSSRRIVPIHPVLIKLGFLEHVDDLRKRGSERLWPHLERRRDKYSDTMQKWYYRYNRKYITQNRKKVFHSFRHNFADALKQAHVPEAIMKELMGHAHGGLAMGRYGKRYRVALLLEAIKKIDYGITIKENHTRS